MKDTGKIIISGKDEFSTIPFSFDGMQNSFGFILAGDIGGTKTNLSLYELNEGVLTPILEQTFLTNNFSSFRELYASFKNGDLPDINSICLGVAGPVLNGKVSGTNFSWAIDAQKLQKELEVNHVTVINDLEANAYGLAALEVKDFKLIKAGRGEPGNCAIIAPGTGLGEAGLFWDGKYYHPFATEGGHCDFSPRNELDIAMLRFLQKQFGMVSWERLLSGPGIYNIYKFLVDHNKIKEPQWFTKRLQKEDPAALISACAVEDKYAVCKDTMDLFTRYLAIEASQVALKFKATGGIYIGGGILPKIIRSFEMEVFTKNFLEIDRMRPLLETISVSVILNEHSPKYGTALFGAKQLARKDT